MLLNKFLFKSSSHNNQNKKVPIDIMLRKGNKIKHSTAEVFLNSISHSGMQLSSSSSDNPDPTV
jgi:hypothetical protein